MPNPAPDRMLYVRPVGGLKVVYVRPFGVLEMIHVYAVEFSGVQF